MLPGQPAPGGLDRRLARSGVDAQDGMRITGGHRMSLATPRGRRWRDVPRGRTTPPPGRLTGSLARCPLPSCPSLRRAGVAAAVTAVPVALAYRFAVVYRTRAGFPRRTPPAADPSALGLPFEALVVDAPGADLPAWFIPAEGAAPGPAVLIVHGWESARDRMLPHALVLHEAGFHVLVLDVRGHGANQAESLPISAGEFGLDAAAGVAALVARPEVTRVAILGHSMGGIGAILAAADDPRVDALVVVSSPADPTRLTRETFRLASLPIPDPLAYPLAWLTAHVYVRPRGHLVSRISSTGAIRRYHGPLLLVHGAADRVIPRPHHERLLTEARRGRAGLVAPAPIETLIVPDGAHSWLYEHEVYRRRVAAFLASALGGPLRPEVAAERAAAADARRLPEGEQAFSGVDGPNARLRTLAQLIGAPIRPPAPRPIPRSSRPPPRSPDMDIATAIATHRVVREFAPRPLEAEHLQAILEAGRRAGSSKNSQRWDFIVVRDRDRLRELSASGRHAGHLAGAALAVALVTPDPRAGGQPLSVMWDLGGAAARMMLAAWACGIGSCPATVYEQDLVRRLLGYPGDRWCEYLLSFGYPADPAVLTAPLRAGGRRPFEEVVHEERW